MMQTQIGTTGNPDNAPGIPGSNSPTTYADRAVIAIGTTTSPKPERERSLQVLFPWRVAPVGDRLEVAENVLRARTCEVCHVAPMLPNHAGHLRAGLFHVEQTNP